MVIIRIADGQQKIRVNVIYVPKEEIEPLFGIVDYRTNTIKIRRDLPRDVKKHILIHEVGHILGHEGEISANLFALKRDPKGWVKTAFSTLKDSERILYYFKMLT